MTIGMRARRRLAATVAATLSAAPLLIAIAPTAEAAACGAKGNECYAESLSPSSFFAGASTQFTFGLNYEGDHDGVGSLNITAPTGYNVTNVGAPSSGTATISAGVIQLRSMGLTPGGHYSVTFTADTPSSGVSATWSAPARECANFNCAGSDLVFDSANSSVTTNGVTNSNANCAATDVSCGTNFISYGRASSVSTGSAANSSVWLVGTTNFPATSATGGELYNMHAPQVPGAFCPVNGVPAQCTFEMDIDPLPAPYDAAHSATLTLLCDQSHCHGNSVTTMAKRDDKGNVSTLPLCSTAPSALCYSFTPNSTGLTITIRNIKAGDPSFAGISVP